MRILAVIPARAGSKGIPNKNIRIIGGHPLIYYAIHNALQSKFITDVIVSTDSDVVKEYVGTFEDSRLKVKDRSPELCLDDVTLDAVIYDAIPKEIEWDYIVTLQPTSPTLKADTLDQAIQYAIKENLDTCISVSNKPHLAWVQDRDRVKPAYQKRLNRQYLPPYYMENGAFVISKSSVVTSATRIGTKINVYQISEEEAVDVDSFYDLMEVDKVLSAPKVAFYVNGNNKRGMGHIYRTLEIADELFLKPDIYYDTNQTKREFFGATTYDLIPVNGTAELFDRCREKQYSVFINDILSTTVDYMYGLKSVLPKDAQIINFEDEGEGSQIADIVINALFENSDQKNVYAGSQYYIAKKNFLFYPPVSIREKATRVFICFGGSDPMNYTDRILQIVNKPAYSQYQFRIALGKAKENVNELMKYNDNPSLGVFYDVQNMPSLMSSCDIAITSRGRTAYELAMLGIPTIVISENEREKSHSFICNENGFSYIGYNPTDEIIESQLNAYLHLSKESRQSLQDKLLSHDLRHGRERVMKLINA